MLTLNPPAGAGPFNVTEPENVSPAFVVPGIETPARPSGSTERVAVTLAAAYVAVRTTGVEMETDVLDTLEPADHPPAGMVTLDGTVAVPGDEDARAMTVPAG